MPMSPTIVCNNILSRGFAEKRDISPMKLQKLMYFVACEYQKDAHTVLFSEPFEVWRYGPVIRSVYDEFKAYGKNAISSYAKDAKGTAYIVDESTSPKLKNAINRIWNAFKDWEAIPLSNITHEDKSGWSSAYDRHLPVISSDQMEADNTYVHYLSNC